MKIEDVKILVACEESQTVTKAFRKLGASAFSCDLQDCSGGHPEWHYKNDAIKIMNSEEWLPWILEEKEDNRIKLDLEGL